MPDKITDSNQNIANAAISNIKRNIDLAAKLDVRKLVLHPPKYSQKAADIYQNLINYAEQANVILAVENCIYGEPGIEELLRYKEIIDSDFFRFTFDMGHCNITGNPVEGLKKLGSVITHIHYHDNDGTKDQHIGPGQGNINFTEFALELKKLPHDTLESLTITLECDKPVVDYPKALKRTMELING